MPPFVHSRAWARVGYLYTPLLYEWIHVAVSGTTERAPIGSPACWAILLAQQAHAAVYGWEMDEAGACKQPVSLRCSVCAALMFARLIASRSASLERASDA